MVHSETSKCGACRKAQHTNEKNVRNVDDIIRLADILVGVADAYGGDEYTVLAGLVDALTSHYMEEHYAGERNDIEFLVSAVRESAEGYAEIIDEDRESEDDWQDEEQDVEQRTSEDPWKKCTDEFLKASFPDADQVMLDRLSESYDEDSTGQKDGIFDEESDDDNVCDDEIEDEAYDEEIEDEVYDEESEDDFCDDGIEDEAYDEGFENGYSDGYWDGFEDAYDRAEEEAESKYAIRRKSAFIEKSDNNSVCPDIPICINIFDGRTEHPNGDMRRHRNRDCDCNCDRCEEKCFVTLEEKKDVCGCPCCREDRGE